MLVRTIKPIFLISLPRSGSTLLQKILMSNKDVASHAEPWFVLPLLYGMKTQGIKTEYGQNQAFNAINNICKSLPNGRDDYEAEIKSIILGIYSKLAKGRHYFLDKTPRYYFILDDLHRLFPDAKFIYLFRSPVSVFSSMVEAFRDNSMRRFDYLDNDLYIGPKNIAKSYIEHKDSSFLIRYEELVCEPEKYLISLCEYLEIEFEPKMITDFILQEINGQGDSLGAKRYKTLSNNSDKWKSMINTKYRKKRLYKYIEKIDINYLNIGQYNKMNLLEEINKLEVDFKPKEYFYGFEEGMIKILKKIVNYNTIA